MTNPTYRIAARPQEIEVTHCSRVLIGSMQRLVIDKNVKALREFHRMGIPLDYALDYSVQKGCMPLIEELLHNLGIVPSETTLLRAMQRGITIRNMFLARVTATVRHVSSGGRRRELRQRANILLDRGVEPNFETVSVLKGSGKQSEERRLFIDRLVATLDIEILKRDGTLRKMALWTSISQFERAMDRVGKLPQHELNKLLTDCLRASAPGHARAVINRGAQFLPEHLDVAADATWLASHNNPKAEWSPVLCTVLETAIDEECHFEGSDDVYTLVRPLVNKFVGFRKIDAARGYWIARMRPEDGGGKYEYEPLGSTAELTDYDAAKKAAEKWFKLKADGIKTDELRELIDDARSKGCASLRSMAEHLNDLGVGTPRGGRWGSRKRVSAAPAA